MPGYDGIPSEVVFQGDQHRSVASTDNEHETRFSFEHRREGMEREGEGEGGREREGGEVGE